MKFSNLLCIDNSNHDTWEEVLKDEADESVDDPALRKFYERELRLLQKQTGINDLNTLLKMSD